MIVNKFATEGYVDKVKSFIVSLAADEDGNAYTSCTYDEIVEAFSEGRPVYMTMEGSGYMIPFTSFMEGQLVFDIEYDATTIFRTVINSDGAAFEYITRVTPDDTQSLSDQINDTKTKLAKHESAYNTFKTAVESQKNLLYSSQTLTDAEKSQARKNIEAASTSDIKTPLRVYITLENGRLTASATLEDINSALNNKRAVYADIYADFGSEQPTIHAEYIPLSSEDGGRYIFIGHDIDDCFIKIVINNDVDRTITVEEIPVLREEDVFTPDTQFTVAKATEGLYSHQILNVDTSGADVLNSDNSEYFNFSYFDGYIVNRGPYKINKDTILSLQNKKMAGDGSVAWKDWDTQPQNWKDSEDPTMLSSKLKVKYADDPVYMSMKLPGEANFVSDTLVRPAMRASNNSGIFVMVDNMAAIMAVNYTQLPDDVVICIGNMSLYTLSRSENAKWKLHTKDVIPTGYGMFYLPWSDCDDKRESISNSKITVYDDHIRFALKREDFAPDTSVAAKSLGKCLHFWGEHKNLDLADNLAVITFCEVWTETPAAVGNLYMAPGCDQKNADKTKVSQNYWGRNVLLKTEKAVHIGHNISDELYDQLRDTPNDPRLVYADYGASFSSLYDSKQSVADHNTSVTAHQDIRNEINTKMEDMQARINQVSEVIQPLEVLTPSINMNDGVYEAGYFNADGADYVGNYGAQSFRNKNYIPVKGGSTITCYYDKAEWNNNNPGKALYIVQYDANKQVIVGRADFKTYTNNQSSHILDANTAYIRIGFNKWSNITTALTDIKIAIYYIEDARTEFIEYGFGSEMSYGVLSEKVCIVSPNGTKFTLSVSNDGVLSAKPFGT